MNEWQLLRLIQGHVPAAGDDCAVLPFGGTNLLLTTDMLHRASDFPPGTAPYTIGWRSVAVSLSDIAAMGGRPLAVVLAASAPDWEGLLPGVLAGAQAACREAGCELVGGDLDFSRELTLVSSALGETSRPVLRSGARPGDLLCLTGPLGRTALALRLSSRGELGEANRLLRFIPRLEAGRRLAAQATSMLDLSDSLAHSLHLLARASGVGLELRADSLPLVPGVSLDEALYYGEDYELLCTIPPGLFRPELGVEVGRAVEAGVWLIRDGRRVELSDRGWVHGPDAEGGTG
ncbi:thiamine-phosphate kinase [Candidatus Acetothermia bacterium]|nr:MAG: thiamine-phosphate kinase [Candidatus Acetothermia bacterium]